MDGWWKGWMDGWKKLHEKRPRRPLLYVMISPYTYNQNMDWLTN
jgi:hypothetical protein